MRSRLMAILVMVVVLAIAGVGVLYAATTGTLDPPNPPGTTSSYTLEQIYQRLTTGNYFAKQSGFTEPATGPGSTMHTLDEIMAQAQPRALAQRVNQTGQTECWDTDGTLIPCAGTGQDGQYMAGVYPWIAPWSSGGETYVYNTPASWTGVRFTDNGDGTMTDNLTALIWLKNANCLDTVGGIAKGNGYLNWANALTWSNNLTNGFCGLSDGSVAGAWRLPNVNELHSLINMTQSNPALPAGHPFTGVQSNFYWTSTTNAGYGATSNAWYVYLYWGGVGSSGKEVTHYVWPVRGGQ